jgi:hypothetical protein
VEVEPSARRARELGDPWTREAKHGERRAAAVLLVRRQRALPLAGDIEQVDDLIGLEKRPARLRNLQPGAAPRLVPQPGVTPSTVSRRTAVSA